MRTEREKSLHGEGRREERESNDFRLNSLGEERRRERQREEKGRKYREKVGRMFEAITRLEKYKSGT